MNVNSVQQTPTLLVTLIYIRSHLSNRIRNDLKIYNYYEVKSTFFEICFPKKTDIVFGCIYKYPNMNINLYLNELLDKLSKKPKLHFFLLI